MPTMHLGDLDVGSPAFADGTRIPDRHVSSGADISPELRIGAVPDGTRSFALVCHDPDAPVTAGFDHWVLYNIPADTRTIPEGGGDAYTEGRNSFGRSGYGGPAPPPGHGTHHYFFHLYALDHDPDLDAGLSREELLDAIDEHILEQARIVGTYSA